MKIVKKSEKIKLIIVSFLWVVLCFSIILYRYTPVFLRIDDVKMRWIISGAYLGENSGHAFFLKYPFSYIIKMLYSSFPNHYWYGFCFIVIHALCLYLIIFKILVQFGKGKFRNHICLSILATLIFLFFDIDNILNLEFTSLAAICGSTGLFLLIVDVEENSIKKNIFDIIGYTILFVLCYSIRLSVFNMIVFFIIAIILFSKISIKYIAYNWKESLDLFWKSNKKIFIITIFLVFAIGIIKITNTIAYISEDWKEFKSYNSKRSSLYDYDDTIPDFYENIDFYEDMGIDENSYMAIIDYNIGFPEHISMESINLISDYNKNVKMDRNIKDALFTVYEVLFDEDFAFITVILMFLSFINICLFFFIKNGFSRGYLICIVGILFECVYVALGDRFPERVVIAILLVWNAINWGYLLNNLKMFNYDICNYKSIVVSKKFEFVLLSFIVLFLLSFVLNIKYTKLTYEIDETTEKLSNIQPIKDYVSENVENFYFMTTHLISRKYAEAWNEELNYCNFHELGGWEMFSPCFEKKMEKEEFDSIERALLKENVYLITDEQYVIEYISKYYNNKYGENVIPEIESVIPGNSCEFYVIKFLYD